MYGQYLPGLPGRRSTKTSRHKIIFKGGPIPDDFPQGKLIDGAKSRDPSNTDNVGVLQAGLMMGKITSSGYYAPTFIGALAALAAVGATTLTVSAAVATELVRRLGSAVSGTFKVIGPPLAGDTPVVETVTYSAINTTSGAITVTATANAFIAGSLIAPTDGSENPITMIPDGHGIPVVEYDGTQVAVVEFPLVPVGGIVISDELINWPSDTALQDWIVQQYSALGRSKFIFDHLY